MKHFTTKECIDFVNQVISLRRNQEGQKHLKQGCKRCARAVWLWHRVGRIAEAEAKLEPPQDAVRIASASVCWASLNNLRMAALQLGQQPNNTGARGGQPLCVETSDFTATVTSFRTSTVGTSRIINVSVRFQNRTSQPLVLGYVSNSGITTDERGNRYIVYGGNGFRGIGLVYGSTFDPRFSATCGFR
jgi:hypothetical protein